MLEIFPKEFDADRWQLPVRAGSPDLVNPFLGEICQLWQQGSPLETTGTINYQKFEI